MLHPYSDAQLDSSLAHLLHLLLQLQRVQRAAAAPRLSGLSGVPALLECCCRLNRPLQNSSRACGIADELMAGGFSP